MSTATHDLSLLAVNLTRRCNLSCAHCYLDARNLREPDENELTTEQVQVLLDDVAAMGQGSMIVLTGGEPLIRKDLETLVKYGTSLDLPIVIGTNGMMLSQRRVDSLKESGVLGLGISLDSLDPSTHDSYRGRSGAWAKTVAGIENCRRSQVDFQLHFSVTDSNAHELPSMVEFASSCGARALNVFFLVCVGRARSVMSITQQKYEAVLANLVELQADYPGLIVRPRCAPHYKRIAYQLHPEALVNRISGRDGDGCIAGIHYARVNHRGAVTACPYIEQEVGNINMSPFSQLWTEAEDFRRLRSPHLKGKCGDCEYRVLCGGCRARPMASGKDLLDEDDLCAYQPKGAKIIEDLTPAEISTPSWSPEAQQRLSRVPGFLRKMVKKRAEAYVSGLGEQCITTQHLSTMAAARFGASGPPKFSVKAASSKPAGEEA